MDDKRPYRLELTLSDEQVERLDGARGHEPRASFVKRWIDGLELPLTPEQQADVDRVVGDATGVEAMARLQAEGNRRSAVLLEAKHRVLPSPARAPVRAHAPTCRCPVCSPPK